MKIKWLTVCEVSLSSHHIKTTTKRKKQGAYFPADWFTYPHEAPWKPF